MRRGQTMLAALLVLALVGCDDGATDGTLEALVDPGGETTGHVDFSVGPDKSYGIFVCTRDGTVELESIEPLHIEGEIEFLGATIYTSDDKFVGAAHGYPPDGIDETKLEDLEGAVIDSDCDDPPGDARVQLLIGAERTGSGGGVVDGLSLVTSGGELEIPLTILLCGDEMQYCEVLVPEEG